MQRPGQERDVLSCQSCAHNVCQYEKYWECSARNPYVLCCKCFNKMIEKVGTAQVTCPHHTCVDNGLHCVKPNPNSVHIFMDNSNFWIEGKKQIARNLNLKSEEDPRFRLDIEKLAWVVARGRLVARKKLYGSEHKRSPSTSLWEEFEQNGWKCEVTKRMHKEKGVDQQLVADITNLVSEAHVEVGTVIILCGDGDVKPAISICMKKKWKCEVVMWEGSISDSLIELSKHYPQLVKIVKADQYLEEVSYTKSKFCLSKIKDIHHLKSQAAVVLDSDVNIYDKRWVKKMTAYLGWPFECCPYGGNNQHLLLVLVSSKHHETDKENAKEYFDVFLSKLKTKYGDKALSYVEHEQHERRNATATKETSFQCTNRFKPLEKEDGETNSDSLLSEKEVGQPSHSGQESNSSSSCSTLCVNSPKFTDSKTPCYNFDSRRSSHTSSGVLSRESDLSLSRSTSRVSVASSGYEGFRYEGQDRYQTVVGRVKRNSMPNCRDKGSCPRGSVCRFRHTEEELEFFKDRRKRTQCWWGKKCSKSQCSYVHTPEEGFCCLCSKWGHLEGERCRR